MCAIRRLRVADSVSPEIRRQCWFLRRDKVVLMQMLRRTLRRESKNTQCTRPARFRGEESPSYYKTPVPVGYISLRAQRICPQSKARVGLECNHRKPAPNGISRHPHAHPRVLFLRA